MNNGICQSNRISYNCSCVNNYYGTNCQYFSLNSTTFVNSSILTQEQGNALLNLANLSSTSIYAKIYSASINGFGAVNFHSKCDNVLGTLIVIKTINSYVFGGFTLANWGNNGGYQTDANAFIFSLINQYNYPVRLNVTNAANAIFASSSYGPIFGNGFDLYIADQFISNTNSRTQLGNAYQLPLNMTYGTMASQSFLAGSYYFQPIEIEVYSINGNLLFYFI